jgi:RNA polymerase sigma-70 factor (ECF subfamily)
MNASRRGQVTPARPDPESPRPRAVTPELRRTAERVFHEHGPRIYSLARRLLTSDADAEDVTQEVLLQVLRKLPEFRGESALGTWLYRVTVNTALGLRRKRARRSEQQATGCLGQLAHEQRDRAPVKRWRACPQEAALCQEEQQTVAAAVRRLPELYRDVFVLADLEGLGNAEVGELLGLSLPAVKSRLHRARLMLRDALAPYYEEVPA